MIIPGLASAPARCKAICILFPAFCASATGCAPRTLPARWLDRQLFESQHAYVYASNDIAAAEAERLVDKVVYQCKISGIRECSRGLLIVTDVTDKLILENLDLLFRLSYRMPGYRWISDDGPHAQRELIGRSGIDRRQVLAMKSCLLGKDDLVNSLGLDRGLANKICWAAAIPTRAVIRRTVEKTVGAALERMLGGQEMGGKRFAAGVALTPLKYKAKSMLEAERDIIIYAALVTTDTSRDSAQMGGLVKAYSNWRRSGPSWYRGTWSAKEKAGGGPFGGRSRTD